MIFTSAALPGPIEGYVGERRKTLRPRDGPVRSTGSALLTLRFMKSTPEPVMLNKHECRLICLPRKTTTHSKRVRGSAVQFMSKNNNPDHFLKTQITVIYRRGRGVKPQQSTGLTVCSTDNRKLVKCCKLELIAPSYSYSSVPKVKSGP